MLSQSTPTWHNDVWVKSNKEVVNRGGVILSSLSFHLKTEHKFCSSEDSCYQHNGTRGICTLALTCKSSPFCISLLQVSFPWRPQTAFLFPTTPLMCSSSRSCLSFRPQLSVTHHLDISHSVCTACLNKLTWFSSGESIFYYRVPIQLQTYKGKREIIFPSQKVIFLQKEYFYDQNVSIKSTLAQEKI